MSKIKDTDYLFASARIRALERTLLNRERIDRMLDARTLEDSYKVLAESEYGDGQELPVDQYETLLAQEHQKTFDLVRSLEPRLMPLLELQYDYLNAKILLKAEFLGIDDYLTSDLGSFPLDKMKTGLSERTFVDMSPTMKEAVMQAIDSFGKTGDPQIIDLILDAATFEEIRLMKDVFDNPYINGYISREIDIVNIKTTIRLKQQNAPKENFQKLFVEGGTLDLSKFLSHFDEDFSNLVQAFAYTDYGKMLEAALPGLNEGNLGAFEKLCDDYRMEQLKSAKYVPFGIEPLMAYAIAKENDLKNARIILTGKAAGLESQRIAEKVRETYV
jgi:V/A-type H+-transporting ATPase subunit C